MRFALLFFIFLGAVGTALSEGPESSPTPSLREAPGLTIIGSGGAVIESQPPSAGSPEGSTGGIVPFSSGSYGTSVGPSARTQAGEVPRDPRTDLRVTCECNCPQPAPQEVAAAPAPAEEPTPAPT